MNYTMRLHDTLEVSRMMIIEIEFMRKTCGN